MGKKIVRAANFDVEVVSVTVWKNFSGERLKTILKLVIKGERATEETEIEFGELNSIDFESLHHSFLINAELPRAREKIIYNIKQQAAELPEIQKVMLDKLGWYRSENTTCYNAGDRVISSDGNVCYELNKDLANYRLEIDECCEEREAINKALQSVYIDFKYSSVIFCAGLMGILRSLILEAGIKPPSVLYLVGVTQSRKTTLATFCTRMYNRSVLAADSETQMARVSSTVVRLEKMLDDNKDNAFIVDDLFRDPDSKMRREYERRVRGMLRNYADNSSRKTAHSQYEINGQLIITAEYLLDSVTDLGRMFILHVDSPVKVNRLTEMQKEPLALSTFYYFFIRHICGRYAETVEFIREEFRKCRNGVTHRYERVNEMATLLIIMMKILCRYARELGVLSDKTENGILTEFQSEIYKCVRQHDEIMSIKRANSSEINLSLALLCMMENKYICKGKKESDCFTKHNYLYVRVSAITAALKKHYRIDMSSKSVTSYFSKNDISQGYNSPKNVRNVRKYNGRSYLILDWNRLQEAAMAERNPLEKIQ